MTAPGPPAEPLTLLFFPSRRMNAATRPTKQLIVQHRKTCNPQSKPGIPSTFQALQSTPKLRVPGSKKTPARIQHGRAYCLRRSILQRACLALRYCGLRASTVTRGESITAHLPPSLTTGWCIFCTAMTRRSPSAMRLRMNSPGYSTCTMATRNGAQISCAGWGFCLLRCRRAVSGASRPKDSLPRVFSLSMQTTLQGWASQRSAQNETREKMHDRERVCRRVRMLFRVLLNALTVDYGVAA